MSGASEKARDTYTTGLRNQHAVENQAIERLTAGQTAGV